MSEKRERGKKRSKAFYRKSSYGGKKPRMNGNVLEPGIRGFLVMCNHNEKSAVKESYNLLNEYADRIFCNEPSINVQNSSQSQADNRTSDEDSSEDDDVEKAMKKEIDGMKAVDSSHKRFQNVSTKAKNCIFIRTTLENPVEIVMALLNDIASKKLSKARFAARILPIIGTCKANTGDIEKLAADLLKPVFSPGDENVPKSYTILFKSRNNNGNHCGRAGVIPSLIKIVKDINPLVKFSWAEYSVAILVEIVCTMCCLGVAPDYVRLRKYNLQQLTKGDKSEDIAVIEGGQDNKGSNDDCQIKMDSDVCKDKDENMGIVENPEKQDLCDSNSCEKKGESAICENKDEFSEDPSNLKETLEIQGAVNATKNESQNIYDNDSNKSNCLTTEIDNEINNEEDRETEETVSVLKSI